MQYCAKHRNNCSISCTYLFYGTTKNAQCKRIYVFLYSYFQVATVLDWVRDLVGADHYNMENCGVTMIIFICTISIAFTSKQSCLSLCDVAKILTDTETHLQKQPFPYR